MRSITTHVSEQRVTCVKINEDGDLMFTAGADGLVSVWRIADGQRLGTYHHIRKAPYSWNLDDLREEMKRPTKAVTHIDVNRDSTLLAVCRFDTVLIFDVETGQLNCVITEDAKVECCEFSQNPKAQDRLLVGVTDVAGGDGAFPSFKIYKCENLTRNADAIGAKQEWTFVSAIKDFEGGNPTTCAWGPFDKYVIGGTEKGKVYMWDADTGRIIHMRSAHQESITCISHDNSRSVFLTVSLDKTAKLWSTLSFAVIREILVDRPLRACTLNPLFDHPDPAVRRTTMLLAGGQEAREVTTTTASEGFFEILLVDAVTGDEVNRVLCHYSPTYCVYWHPNGHIFATGAYEGNSKIVFAK